MIGGDKATGPSRREVWTFMRKGGGPKKQTAGGERVLNGNRREERARAKKGAYKKGRERRAP